MTRHRIDILRTAVLATLILTGSASFAQGPSLASEPFTIGDPTLGPAAWRQVLHDVASLGDASYVAWVDTRSVESWEIRGALIEGDGTVLPRSGTVLSDAAGYFSDPRVVAHGDHFFVVWHIPGNPDRSWGRLINRDGTPLGEPINLGTPVQYRRIHVANATGFLTLEQQALTLVRPDGSVVELPVSELDALNVIAATSLDDDFIFIASDYVTARETFVRITPDGEFEMIEIDVDRGYGRTELVESGGELYVVAGGSPLAIFRIDLDAGTSTPVAVPASAPSGSIWWLKSGGDGSLLFAWEHWPDQSGPRELLVMRIDPRDGSHMTLNTGIHGRYPVLVQAGTGLRLFFQSGPEEGFDLRYTLLGNDLTTLEEPAVVTWAQSAQSNPAAATNGQGTVGVVWEEERDGRRQIAYAVRPAIGPISSSALLAPSPANQVEPAIASDGSGYLVVWRSARDNRTSVVAARIAADGTILDDTPIELGDSVADNGNHGPIAALWNGQRYLVAFSDSAFQETMRVVSIDRDGTVDPGLPGPVPPSERGGMQHRPSLALAADGTTLLVWQDGDDFQHCRITCPQPIPGVIRALRLNQEGSILDPVPLTISTDEDEVQRFPVVAASGNVFLVVWERGAGLRAARVTTSGAVLDHDDLGQGIRLPALTFEAPTVASFGSDFFVSWTDPSGPTGMPNHLMGLTLDAAGALGERQLLSVGVQRYPSATELPNGSVLLLNTAVLEEAGGVSRLIGRVIEDGEPKPRRRGVRRR